MVMYLVNCNSAKIWQNLHITNAFTRWQHKFRTVSERLVYMHLLQGQLWHNVSLLMRFPTPMQHSVVFAKDNSCTKL